MYSLCDGNPMNVGKDYILCGSPGNSLDSVTSYLADKGYGIETCTENKVSMCRHSITAEWVLVILTVSLFTYGAALLGLLALYFIKSRVSVVARPVRAGASLVTLTWSNQYAKRALEAWLNVEWGDKARPWRPGTSRWGDSPHWSTWQEQGWTGVSLHVAPLVGLEGGTGAVSRVSTTGPVSSQTPLRALAHAHQSTVS
jgi:hypothetical protein